MITSDAHEGILSAVAKDFPTVPWQRCQFHSIRNVTDKAPKKYQSGLRTELHIVFDCKTIAKARKIRKQIMDDYRDVAESAVACLNKELKRCSKAIGVFPNEDSVMRLMGLVLIERHDIMLAGREGFSKESLASLLMSDVHAKRIVIAEEQRQLLAA